MAENSNTNTGKRGFLSSSTMDYEKAGIASRSLTNWMLTHATVEAWTQFFHQPYKCDIGEARVKAIERYEFETGEKWDSVSIKTCTYAFFNNKDKDKKEKENV